MTSESWRPIPSTGGMYEASDRGRIRRAATDNRRGIAKPKEAMKPKVEANGYLRVGLTIAPQTPSWHAVHRLVAEAFVGEPPDGLYVNHKDGNKQNNSPANLEYVTPRENAIHASRNSLLPTGNAHWARRTPDRLINPRGERHGNSKLKEADVIEIRRLRKEDALTQKAIAERFGVDISLVSRIVSRELWNHV